MQHHPPFIAGNLQRAGLRALACLAALCCLAAPAPGAPPAEDLMFYQIFLDRFFNGDPGNDSANPRTTADYAATRGHHGGDLEGVRQKLGYIADLGVNAIWVTPFVENVYDYHGYGAYDFYNVDPNFGDLAKLQQLVNEANALGIHVYYDVVAGHCGNLIDSTEPGYPDYIAPPGGYTMRWSSALRYPPPFDDLGHFHNNGTIGFYFGEEQERGELFGLDDLATGTPYVRDEMFKIWQYWVQNTGVSGFRVDTIKHVDLGFWEDFLPRIRAEAAAQGRTNFFMFGEAFGYNDALMDDYIGTLTSTTYKFDAALDFQFYQNAQNIFARNTAAPAALVDRLSSRSTALPGHHLMMPNFFDNHDVPRFMHVANQFPGGGLEERLNRLELALTFLFVAPGPPVVYYGTEQAFDGGEDPYNREDMFDGLFEQGPSEGDNFNNSSRFYRLTATLADIRQQLAPLRRGDWTRRFADPTGPGALAVTRTYNGETVVVLMNTATDPTTIPAFIEPTLANRTLIDTLNPLQSMAVDGAGGFPAMTLEPQAAQIWAADSSISPAPRVIEFTPGDMAQDVSIETPSIVITFSDAMNQSLTESQISVDPAVDYTTSWNAQSSVLTLALDEYLTGDSTYIVRVEVLAENQSGVPLSGPHSATFDTEEPQTPWGGTPLLIAAGTRTRIEAEFYDEGGEGKAYSDTTPINEGNAGGNTFRTTEGVDTEDCLDEGGGVNVGYMADGEYTEYTVDVPLAGRYHFDLRVATPMDGPGYRLERDGTDLSGAVAIPNTGDWQAWTTVRAPQPVMLEAGIQVLRLHTVTGLGNINWFELTGPVDTGAGHWLLY